MYFNQNAVKIRFEQTFYPKQNDHFKLKTLSICVWSISRLFILHKKDPPFILEFLSYNPCRSIDDCEATSMYWYNATIYVCCCFILILLHNLWTVFIRFDIMKFYFILFFLSSNTFKIASDCLRSSASSLFRCFFIIFLFSRFPYPFFYRNSSLSSSVFELILLLSLHPSIFPGSVMYPLSIGYQNNSHYMEYICLFPIAHLDVSVVVHTNSSFQFRMIIFQQSENSHTIDLRHYMHVVLDFRQTENTDLGSQKCIFYISETGARQNVM